MDFGVANWFSFYFPETCSLKRRNFFLNIRSQKEFRAQKTSIPPNISIFLPVQRCETVNGDLISRDRYSTAGYRLLKPVSHQTSSTSLIRDCLILRKQETLNYKMSKNMANLSVYFWSVEWNDFTVSSILCGITTPPKIAIMNVSFSSQQTIFERWIVAYYDCKGMMRVP